MELNLIALSFMWFGVSAVGYGITLFLPPIVHSLTELTPFKTGLLSALPPTAMFGLVVFGYTSDRFGERRWHDVLSLLAATAGYVAATWLAAPVPRLRRSRLRLSVSIAAIQRSGHWWRRT